MKFEYPCPACRTRNNLHEVGCKYESTPMGEIESTYIDILSQLTTGPTDIEVLEDGTELYDDALAQLRNNRRMESDGETARLLTPEEYKEQIAQPRSEPMKTIYEKGSVPGAHDNSVFALIAYYEMVGLSWEETREKMLEWVQETGTWERGGFAESSPEMLIDNKKHVHEEGYGWKEKASAAKTVIDRTL